MPKVSSYTLLAAAGIDRTNDSLYVVDATGPSSKRATVAGLWDAGLPGSHALLGNVTFTGAFTMTLSGVGFSSAGGAFAVSSDFPEIQATDSLIVKTPRVTGASTKYGQPLFTDGTTSGVAEFNDLREDVIAPVFLTLTASRALADTDHGDTLIYNGSTPITLTVADTLRNDFWVRIVQNGTGKITIGATGAATINGPQGHLSTGHQYATIEVRAVSATGFLTSGHVGA